MKKKSSHSKASARLERDAADTKHGGERRSPGLSALADKASELVVGAMITALFVLLSWSTSSCLGAWDRMPTITGDALAQLRIRHAQLLDENEAFERFSEVLRRAPTRIDVVSMVNFRSDTKVTADMLANWRALIAKIRLDIDSDRGQVTALQAERYKTLAEPARSLGRLLASESELFGSLQAFLEAQAAGQPERDQEEKFQAFLAKARGHAAELASLHASLDASARQLPELQATEDAIRDHTLRELASQRRLFLISAGGAVLALLGIVFLVYILIIKRRDRDQPALQGSR